MADYNYFDLFSIFIISVSIFFGYFRGVTQEIFAILNWVFSGFLALFFAPIIVPHLKKVPILSEVVYQNCELEILISIALCFIVLLIFLSLFTPVFSRIIQKSNLKGLDNSLGILFGFIRGVIIICLLLLAHEKLLGTSEQIIFVTDSATKLIVADFMTSLEEFTPSDIKSWLRLQYSNMTQSCNT